MCNEKEYNIYNDVKIENTKYSVLMLMPINADTNLEALITMIQLDMEVNHSELIDLSQIQFQNVDIKLAIKDDNNKIYFDNEMTNIINSINIMKKLV